MLTWFTFICSLLADFISIIMFTSRVFYIIIRLKKSIYKKKLLILLFRYIKFIIIIKLIKVMAKIKQGIFGAISGKIGNLVGSSWKGIAVMKIKAASVSNPKTSGQVAQRSNFKNAVKFASEILSPIIIPLWNRFSVQMSGFNSFVQSNISNFTTPMPNIPANLIMSTGKIGATTINSITASSITNHVDFTWTDDSGSENKLSTDVAYLLAINVSSGVIMGAYSGDTRSSGGSSIPNAIAPAIGESVWGYIAFRRADGTMVSNSSSLYFHVVA